MIPRQEFRLEISTPQKIGFCFRELIALYEDLTREKIRLGIGRVLCEKRLVQLEKLVVFQL